MGGVVFQLLMMNTCIYVCYSYIQKPLSFFIHPPPGRELQKHSDLTLDSPPHHGHKSRWSVFLHVSFTFLL